MANFTAGTSFTDGVTNDVTAAKLNALVADAVPTSNLALASTTGTISNFTASTANITLGMIPTLTAGTTTGTAGIFTSGTITTGLIPTLTVGTTTSTAGIFTSGTITTGVIPTLTTGTTTSTNEVVTNGTITNLSATTSTFLGAITASTAVINVGSGQIYKDSSGRIGIGTTSPDASYRMTVSGSRSGVAPGIILTDSDATPTNYGLYINGNKSFTIFDATAGVNRLLVDSSGNVLTGGTNTEPAGNATSGVAIKPPATSANGMVEICNANLTALVLGSTTGDATLARFRRAGSPVGSISVTAGATAFVTSSDYRLKTNLEAIANGIERIKQLPVYSFNWKIDESGNRVDGFIAHEARSVVPESVVGEKDAVDADGNPIYQGIDQSKLVPLLTAALKEAIAKIETLEAKVSALEAA